MFFFFHFLFLLFLPLRFCHLEYVNHINLSQQRADKLQSKRRHNKSSVRPFSYSFSVRNRTRIVRVVFIKRGRTWFIATSTCPGPTRPERKREKGREGAILSWTPTWSRSYSFFFYFGGKKKILWWSKELPNESWEREREREKSCIDVLKRLFFSVLSLHLLKHEWYEAKKKPVPLHSFDRIKGISHLYTRKLRNIHFLLRMKRKRMKNMWKKRYYARTQQVENSHDLHIIFASLYTRVPKYFNTFNKDTLFLSISFFSSRLLLDFQILCHLSV